MGGVATLAILAPGPLSTVQDLGRHGYGRYGVPPSGALDSFALRVANLLVGNEEGEAGIEMTFMGLTAKALTDLTMAITGADLPLKVNGRPLGLWQSHRVKQGDVLSLGMARTGARAYLAVGGGISVPQVMGSKSTNLSSGFGGLEGRPLTKGDVLLCGAPGSKLSIQPLALNACSIPAYPKEWNIRVLWGPQDEQFTQGAKESFETKAFAVTPQSDRVGIRLQGPSLTALDGLETSIISEGVVPGAIQVPGDGQPIILLNETVTGGYRKIATVISADIPKLGQVRPGDRIRFQTVSETAAQLALEELESVISTLMR